MDQAELDRIQHELETERASSSPAGCAGSNCSSTIKRR